jgi:hypothetical protein
MSKILGKVFLLALVSLFIFSSGVFAKPVSLQMAEDVARTHMRANNERERLAALTARKVFEKRSISKPDIIELKDNQTGEILAYVLGLNPKGFIVVSPDTDITPVIAYSFEGNFPLEDFQDNVLLHMVTRDMENRIEAIPILPDELKEKNNDLWEEYLSAESSFLDALASATQYGPYLKTTWDQGSSYNVYCPYDPYYSNYYGRYLISAVGCVATAMAQIINYHEYPTSVTFTNTKADQYCYDYPNTNHRFCVNNPAIASITSIAYPASADMAAKLSHACGISVRMEYTESGSSAQTYNVATALKNKFGYSSATALAYSSYWAGIYGIPYSTSFASILQNNLKDGFPAQLAIDTTHGGHSIVCDGYYSSSPELYHLNYGWGNSDPTVTWWYALSSWKCTTKDGESINNSLKYGVLNIKPPTPGGNDYCRDYGPCSEGQGDCDGNSECQSGLTCVNDVGPKYGWSQATDVCESTSGGTPGDYDYCTLYGPCSAGQGDCDSNAECQSGLSCVDDVGAKYGYDAIVDVCEASTGGNPGDDDYCRDYGPCSAGQGDCDSDSECQSGLTCVNDVGGKYGWKSVTDVCEASTGGGNLTVYVMNWNGTRYLSGATVAVAGKSATTGSGGYVTIKGIAAGTKSITISYGGTYGSSSVDIVANTTVTSTWWLNWVY